MLERQNWKNFFRVFFLFSFFFFSKNNVFLHNFVLLTKFKSRNSNFLLVYLNQLTGLHPPLTAEVWHILWAMHTKWRDLQCLFWSSLPCNLPASNLRQNRKHCKSSLHVIRDTTLYLRTMKGCIKPFVYALRNKYDRQVLEELWMKSRDNMSSLTHILNLRENNADAIKYWTSMLFTSLLVKKDWQRKQHAMKILKSFENIFVRHQLYMIIS